jgi:MFS family permease
MAENEPLAVTDEASVADAAPAADAALTAWNEAQTPRTSLWHNRDYLKFWTGQTISVFGSAITGLALPLTAVSILKATAGQMGILTALATLPFLLVGLFAGVLVDRTRRRPLLLGADVARALLVGSIPLAMALGFLRIELLYVIEFLAGVATVFFDISYQSFLPSLVGREHLVEGNSKMEISSSAAAIAGPGLAGVLINLLTAPFAMVLDAISFLISAATLAWIHAPEPKPAAPAQRPGVWREIVEGLRVVFDNTLLWHIAGCTGTSNLFSSMTNAVFILYLVRQLGLTPETLGLIFAAGAPGFLLGALIAQRWSDRLGVGPAIITSSLLCALAALLVPFARGPQPVLVAILMLAGFLMGLGQVVYNVTQVSLRQAITPGRLLGRMNASMRFLVWGTMPIGALIGGALGQTIGIYPTIVVSAAGGLLAVLWVLFSPLRGLKQQPAPVEE